MITKEKLNEKEIKIKRLSENAIIPTLGSKYSAGMDLYACIEKPITIAPQQTVIVGTGLSFELPIGTFGAVVARSGVATKRGLAPANKVGICDSDYRGEYKVAIHNHSNVPQEIRPNERIAQLIIMPYIPVSIVETNKLSDTERGNGGFGSTGE